MLAKQIEQPQTLNLHSILNNLEKVTVGFHLISENKPRPKDCTFPLVTVQSLGVDNLVSAKLIWKGEIPMELVISDGFENDTKVVYNLLKSQCKAKNKYQLYITINESNINVEYFIAEGFVYVYI